MYPFLPPEPTSVPFRTTDRLTDRPYTHTALVPAPLLPRPPAPLQPSLSRSDEPLQRARDHRAPLRAHARPRTAPPLRARRHPRTRQVLGRRRTRIHRRARRAPPPLQAPRAERPHGRGPPDVGRARGARGPDRRLSVHRDQGTVQVTGFKHFKPSNFVLVLLYCVASVTPCTCCTGTVGLYGRHRAARASRHPTAPAVAITNIDQQRAALRARPRLPPSGTARPSRGALRRHRSRRQRARNDQSAQRCLPRVRARGLGSS